MQVHDQTISISIEVNTEQSTKAIAQLQKQALDFGDSFEKAFTDLVFQGKEFEDVLKGLALSLSKKSFNAAVKPVGNFFEGLGSNLFGSVFGFQDGGLFPSGVGTGSAGGVISSPITFPLGANQRGLAGEAGPEAILPLSRGPDGRLGVSASTSGHPQTVNIHISTPDVESFRQNQGQLAAQMQRILSRGGRNL